MASINSQADVAKIIASPKNQKLSNPIALAFASAAENAWKPKL